MGVAAYNRGSSAISARLDMECQPVEFEVMDMLNGLPKFVDAGLPFGEIRFVEGNDGFWAQCPETGFGFWYSTLREAVRRWRVEIVGYDCGQWVARPLMGIR